MRRIGELLLEHGWVDQANLHRALAEQALAGGRRICSLLIARGLLDPDHAARALGEQHEVAAVLQKHLEHRDHGLASLLPGTLARNLFALPIGHTRAGELIVCVRDPSPDVEAAIKRALDRPLVIAVAPAMQLERLIDETYESDGVGEFEVDLTTGTQLEPVGVMNDPSMLDISAYSLVGLDDVRVTKDHSQTSYQLHQREQTPFGSVMTAPSPPAVVATPKPPTTPPPPSVSLSIGTEPPRSARGLGPEPQGKVMIPPIGESLPRGPLKTPTTPQPLVRLTVDEVIAAIDDATTKDTATEVVMRYAAQRWTASLLLVVKEGAALGHRGNGKHLPPDAVRAVAIPLASPSIVKVAHDSRALVSGIPTGTSTGAISDRLLKLLGSPRHPMAAPVIVANRIACVFVVADPLGPGNSEPELSQLAFALGDAYERIVRDRK
jgi:hypothetical protein